MREIEKPTTNARGDETHPAFAMIKANRVSVGGAGGGAVLFQSDIKHGSTVRITLETATRKRDLNTDWVHAEKQVVEVELSEAQWASFVSSMNTSGVPATLRWTQADGQLPELPYEPRLKESMDEVRGAAEKLFSKAQAAMADYEQALADKAPAKVRNEALRKLHYTLANSEPNMTFAAQSLNEHTENVVQKARADIEAMAYTAAAQHGLAQGQAPLLELPVFDGEIIDAELEA